MSSQFSPGIFVTNFQYCCFRMGRRYMFCGSMLVGGVSCLAILIVNVGEWVSGADPVGGPEGALPACSDCSGWAAQHARVMCPLISLAPPSSDFLDQPLGVYQVIEIISEK